MALPPSAPPAPPTVDQLTRMLTLVGHLISGVRADQWSAPTPCTEWTVRDLVAHLVTVDEAVTAVLTGQALPAQDTDPLGDDPVGAYHRSSAAIRAAFDNPGVLERTYASPFRTGTGAIHLHARLADLLGHAWDLSQATGQSVQLPADVAEQALAFTRAHFPPDARTTGRFGPAQVVPEDAPAVDRLLGFLGRRVRDADTAVS